MFSRALLTPKNYVKTKAHPEGLITEGYLAHESLDIHTIILNFKG